MSLKDKQSQLAQFSGTDGYIRWSPLFPRMTLTDGAKFVADNGGTSGAYWLMDAKGRQESGRKLWQGRRQHPGRIADCPRDRRASPLRPAMGRCSILRRQAVESESELQEKNFDGKIPHHWRPTQSGSTTAPSKNFVKQPVFVRSP